MHNINSVDFEDDYNLLHESAIIDLAIWSNLLCIIAENWYFIYLYSGYNWTLTYYSANYNKFNKVTVFRGVIVLLSSKLEICRFVYFSPNIKYFISDSLRKCCKERLPAKASKSNSFSESSVILSLLNPRSRFPISLNNSSTLKGINFIDYYNVNLIPYLSRAKKCYKTVRTKKNDGNPSVHGCIYETKMFPYIGELQQLHLNKSYKLPNTLESNKTGPNAGSDDLNISTYDISTNGIFEKYSKPLMKVVRTGALHDINNVIHSMTVDNGQACTVNSSLCQFISKQFESVSSVKQRCSVVSRFKQILEKRSDAFTLDYSSTLPTSCSTNYIFPLLKSNVDNDQSHKLLNAIMAVSSSDNSPQTHSNYCDLLFIIKNDTDLSIILNDSLVTSLNIIDLLREFEPCETFSLKHLVNYNNNHSFYMLYNGNLLVNLELDFNPYSRQYFTLSLLYKGDFVFVKPLLSSSVISLIINNDDTRLLEFKHNSLHSSIKIYKLPIKYDQLKKNMTYLIRSRYFLSVIDVYNNDSNSTLILWNIQNTAPRKFTTSRVYDVLAYYAYENINFMHLLLKHQSSVKVVRLSTLTAHHNCTGRLVLLSDHIVDCVPGLTSICKYNTWLCVSFVKAELIFVYNYLSGRNLLLSHKKHELCHYIYKDRLVLLDSQFNLFVYNLTSQASRKVKLCFSKEIYNAARIHLLDTAKASFALTFQHSSFYIFLNRNDILNMLDNGCLINVASELRSQYSINDITVFDLADITILSIYEDLFAILTINYELMFFDRGTGKFYRRRWLKDIYNIQLDKSTNDLICLGRHSMIISFVRTSWRWIINRRSLNFINIDSRSFLLTENYTSQIDLFTSPYNFDFLSPQHGNLLIMSYYNLIKFLVSSYKKARQLKNLCKLYRIITLMYVSTYELPRAVVPVGIILYKVLFESLRMNYCCNLVYSIFNVENTINDEASNSYLPDLVRILLTYRAYIELNLLASIILMNSKERFDELSHCVLSMIVMGLYQGSEFSILSKLIDYMFGTLTDSELELLFTDISLTSIKFGYFGLYTILKARIYVVGRHNIKIVLNKSISHYKIIKAHNPLDTAQRLMLNNKIKKKSVYSYCLQLSEVVTRELN